jgi:iron complex outermembrane receptor protein
MKHSWTHGVLAGCSVMGLSAGAAAQMAAGTVPSGASDTAISDIVVTAQRRVERVQDVPVAISVVSGAQLERQQITQLTDLSRSTASLNFGSVGNSGGGGGGAFIRGIGTSALTRSAESAVGVVVDGVVQGNTNISNLFDISRVEVLRGPQGTLFGQSVSAGVINITTLAPDPTKVSGKVSAELAGNGFAGSEYGRQVIRGGVNIPVSESSAVRVSGYGSRTVGVLRNVFRDKDDRLKEAGVRARYMGEFGSVTVNLIGDYNYSETKNGGFFTLIAASPLYAGTLAACGVTPRRGNFGHCSSFPERQTVKSYGFSGQIDAELGNLMLSSITSYRNSRQLAATDVDRSPTELQPFLNIDFRGPTNYNQFTQEVRLASDPEQPLSFTVGGFYFDANTFDSSTPDTGTIVTVRPPGLPFALISSTIATNHASSQNLSGFGEARVHSGKFTAFAGGRLTRAKQRTTSVRQNVNIFPPVPGSAAFTGDNQFRDTNFSWRIGAQYAPSRQAMIYGTVSTGYKNAQALPLLFLGGDSSNPIVITDRTAQPEKPTAFEAGLKTTLLNGRASFNIDAFYQKTKNLQAQTFLPQAGQPFPTLLPGNVSKVVSKGIEADAFGKIGRNLTLNASAIYNVAKYPADYTDSQNVSLGGRQIAFAPRFAATFSGEYVQSLNGNLEGFVALEGKYRSKLRLSDGLVASQFTIDRSRFTFGGRIGARVADKWSVAVFANNLGASRVPSVLLPTLPSGQAAFYATQSQRQVGLQAQLEF